MRIHAKDCIAIGIDYQERLMPAINDQEEVIKNSQILLKGLEVLGVPQLISRQYPKGLGDTVPGIREVSCSANVCDKTSFSCYGDGGLKAAVEASGRKTVILSGTEAHVCVLQTAIDLLEAGYKVVYVADCMGSRKPIDKKYGIKRAKQEGAVIVTYEQLLFELLAGATNPAFKAVSALVK